MLLIQTLSAQDSYEEIRGFNFLLMAGMAVATESVACHRIDHAFIQTNDPVRRDRGITVQDMPDLHRELRHVAAQLLKAGADRIHYFHAGPAVVAALVGAEFANGACVFFYQYGGGSYTNFGPIRPAAPAA